MSSLIFPFPKLETFIGLPFLSGLGSFLRFAATADALSFFVNCALFSFDIHFGLASPGSLAQGPIASPLLLILFQPPSGSVLLNHLRKSSLTQEPFAYAFLPGTDLYPGQHLSSKNALNFFIRISLL